MSLIDIPPSTAIIKKDGTWDRSAGQRFLNELIATLVDHEDRLEVVLEETTEGPALKIGPFRIQHRILRDDLIISCQTAGGGEVYTALNVIGRR